ncbi:MAG: UDP-N-acetylglucosamine 2-epimerase (non-hydrolyzing) [Candidatus Methanomethylicaceae archaeon]
MKVASIVGARPNFIKLAAVNDVFRECFEHIIIHTGQHYDFEMSKIFFDQLKIPEPNYYLDVGSGSSVYQIGEIIKRSEEILQQEKPDLVIVYGDTNSTLAGALAAIKVGLKVAHIEAGLRIFDLNMPEEVNRRIVDHISSLLFAPTPTALKNLLYENVIGRIHLTGDVHVDVLKNWIKIAKSKSRILEKIGVKNEEYVVATIHRVENVEEIEKLKKIFTLFLEISKYNKIIFPVHPRTKKKIQENGLDALLNNTNNIILTEPLGYLDFLNLLVNCNKVLTDSGGVQREAYLLNKPVIVFRKSTEWMELVEIGWVYLLDLNKIGDYRYVAKSIFEFKPNKSIRGLLGNGKASKKIANIIMEYLREIKLNESYQHLSI